MTGPIVRVEDLRVVLNGRSIVDGVRFSVAPGEVVALVGASGSGKTTTGLALLGEFPPGAEVHGSVHVDGAVGYVPQHPSTVLNPVRRIGGVLREIAARHHTEPDTHVTDALRRAQLPTGRDMLRRYPHQLSGGQQQRVVVAQALLCDPVVVVADEPTTGQDAITRGEVVAELAALTSRGVAIVLLSHDLDVVRALARHVVVLRGGQVVEAGPAAEVLTTPKHEYTQALLNPVIQIVPAPPEKADRLRVAAVSAKYGKVGALHEVGVDAAAGECLAVVGRSGSGKTTLARCIAGLHTPSSGKVFLDHQPLPRTVRRRSRDQVARVQYVFQDARGSFDDYRSIVDQIGRSAIRLRGLTRPDAHTAALAALAEVGLDEYAAARRPAGLSGGELRRAALARALLAQPDVLICDEITAGLDAITQADILEQLAALRARHRLTLLLISHDLDVVARVADRIAVVHEGRLVEFGDATTVLSTPRHVVTRQLLGTAEFAPQPQPRIRSES